jgi:hypothetical protein
MAAHAEAYLAMSDALVHLPKAQAIAVCDRIERKQRPVAPVPATEG